MTQREICTTKFKLNDGTSIPAVGLGTWQGEYGTKEGDQMKESIKLALKIGYRLLDTAQMYGVEDVVGEAIRESEVPREEICLITKFWPHRHEDPEAAFEESIKTLGLDYIDIFLMHWPIAMGPNKEILGPYCGENGAQPFIECWKKMEKLVGPRCRSIGVSNFSQQTLEELLPHATITPVVNEVELHAMNPALKLVPYCFEKGIRVIGYSTLGGTLESSYNPLLQEPIFSEIGKKYGVGPGLVSLSWAVQRGISIIPKSSREERLRQNISLLHLSDEDMDTLNNIHNTLGESFHVLEAPPMIHYRDDGALTLLGWTLQDLGWKDDNGNTLI